MKICVAQTRPLKGDVEGNIARHQNSLELAVSKQANIVVFPELSLTGYEPSLAKELATHQDDPRLDVFQKISDAHAITVGVGMPIRRGSGICISLILFQPHKGRMTYSKKYLHRDEEEFFVGGQNFIALNVNGSQISFAICYEISVTEHAQEAARSGSEIYIASVAKFVNGIDGAVKRLSEIGKRYSMTVLMSNCVGESDGFVCAGRTSVWNQAGALLGQLDDTNEGIIVFETDTQQVIQEVVKQSPISTTASSSCVNERLNHRSSIN